MTERTYRKDLDVINVVSNILIFILKLRELIIALIYNIIVIVKIRSQTLQAVFWSNKIIYIDCIDCAEKVRKET